MISVLLVDDEPALLDITQIFLEKDGKMSVTLSESAKDALALLGERSFDIIISDYEMPLMNGIEFLKAVKAQDLDIPFIIFTGRGREHVAIEALNLGASFYLQKGGDPKAQFAELRNMIMQAVQRKKAEGEVLLNQARLQTMIDLHQMSGSDEHELCMYAMEKAIDLTGSTQGYIAFLNEEETRLSMYAWSRSAAEVCQIRDTPFEYQVEKTGLWGEPVRQRRPIITNDYRAPNPAKRGYPEGHVRISRHMGVPVIDDGRIVMLAGLGNKASEYTDDDIRQVTHLMGGLWQILKRKRTEAELVESEKRFRSYFELPLVGIAILSPDYHWIMANQKLCQMLGYSMDELKALRWTDLTPKEDLEKELSEYQKLLAGEKESHTLEKRYVRKDGQIINVELSTIPVMRENGGVEYFVALIQDISSLKQTKEELEVSNQHMAATLEELRATQDSMNEYCHRLEREEMALRQSEEKFRTMVESAPGMLVITDLKGGITYASPNTLAFTGYTAADLPAETLSLVHQEDRDRIREIVGQVFREQRGVGNIEFRAVRKDGTQWCASSSIEPLRDPQGIILGYLIQTMDITSRRSTEEALKESEEKYRELVENIDEVVFSLDEMGIIRYVSPAVTRILGYRTEEVKDHVFTDFLLTEDIHKAVRGYADLREGDEKGPLTVDWRVKTRTGDTRYVRIALRMPADDDHHTGCTGTLTDIQDRRRALEDIRDREALLQGIFRAAPIGIGMVKDRIFMWVNPLIIAMTGYSQDELVGKSARVLYASEEEFLRVGQEKYPVMWEKGVGSVESRWVRKDGSVIEVLISSSPLNPDDINSPIIFTVSDITDKKWFEAGLIESENLLRSFIDAISQPAYLMDPGGTIISANAAFCTHYSLGEGDAPGLNIYSLLDASIGSAISGSVQEVVSTGREIRFEKTHEGRILLYDLYPIRDLAGNVVRLGVLSFDITDHKRAQEVLSLLNKKLSLLSRITRYDALNRITTLKGYLDLMKAQTDDPLLLTYMHKEERGINALSDLLAFTESYQNVGMASPSWQDVSGAIRKSAELQDLDSVTIYMDCEGLELHADSMLEKVFFSLIENAIRYGGPLSQISFSYKEDADGLLLICEDDGAGIPPDQKEAVFVLGGGQNPGYGLFLVREILSMTGFSIRETGIHGKGARFEIRVPAGSFRFSKA